MYGCFSKTSEAIFVDLSDEQNAIATYDFQEFVIDPDSMRLLMYIRENGLYKRIGIVDIMAINNWVDTRRHIKIIFYGESDFKSRIRALINIYRSLSASSLHSDPLVSTTDLEVNEMVNELTMKRIANDLFSIATRLGEDSKLAESGGAGKRLVTKLIRLRESVMEIVGTLQTGEAMNAGILRSIFEKAHRVEHVGSLTTIKTMRMVARELYQIDQASFDSFTSSFVIDNPDMVEFGRGISSGLGLDDALLIKTPMGDEYIYYLMLKPSKECDF